MNSHGPLTPHELYALVSYLPDPLGSSLMRCVPRWGDLRRRLLI